MRPAEWLIPLRVLRHNSHHATAMAAPTTALARDAMTARCHACRTRNHPLRWRTLFDCWYCPRCETVRIRVVVNQLITELTA